MVNFSGRGPTPDCVVKPDIIAPGANVVGCMAFESGLCPIRAKDLSKTAPGYVKMSGTSMSTPMVSGAVALMLQKRPELTPNEVKYLLKSSAVDLCYPKNQQGWGALDIDALVNSC